MNEPVSAPKGARRFLLLWLALAAVALVGAALVAVVVLSPLRERVMWRWGGSSQGGETPSLDFSRSNSVSVVLGENEATSGVIHIPTERDGLTEVTTVNGVYCRTLNLPPKADGEGRSIGFFYFALDPSFKQTDPTNVMIEVEYYSERKTSVILQYDAQAPARSTRTFYTHCGPAMSVDAAKAWETATFHVRGAAFENSQNGGADFRLEVRPPTLFVRRVTVTRARPEDAI